MDIKGYKERLISVIEEMEAECGESIESVVIERENLLSDNYGNVITSSINVEIVF